MVKQLSLSETDYGNKETEKILQTAMTWSDFLRFLASLILLEPLNPE